MSARLQEDLVAALCDVDCLTHPDRRRQLHGRLPTKLRRRLNTGQDIDVFVRDLVEQAQLRGSLGCVLRWIDFFDDSSLSVRQARGTAAPLLAEEEIRALSGVLGPLYEDAEREVGLVRAWLDRVGYKDVESLYMELVAGRSDTIDSPRPGSAWEALMDLAELPRPLSGDHPLHVFCFSLARYSEGPAAGPLRAWARNGVATLEPLPRVGGPGTITETQVVASTEVPARYREQKVDRDADGSTGTPARLVVWVTHADRRNRYLVEHWTRLRDDPHGPVEFREHGHPGALPPEEIGRYVCDLVDGLESDRRMVFHDGIRVEWVIPLALISELRAELWQQAVVPSDAVGDQRLGARAQVVYRLPEFARRGDESNGALEACDRKWTRLCRSGSGGFLDVHDGNGSRGHQDAEQRIRLIEDDDLAIFATGSCSHEEWLSDVSCAVSAGVPVVVWRSERHRHQISDGLGAMRSGAKMVVPIAHIRGFPLILHESRTQSVRCGDPGYIRDSFGVSVIYHDSQPLRPPEAGPLSVSGIR
ncbi:hypothetical protein [Nocardiopsis aegyptia]|uniref:vWA-MoxR associated protein middle region 0 domain-containing protein n=1 Tax=Nocardiopsis aegyptia TaxID=220378 RepID=A0A7Z0JAJ7_9ACTN|nr:hypothetical protein [Nocardiopsis aegyptia]NYJ34847.1 hypothetical protein [Nocardiopsis aegyptia]